MESVHSMLTRELARAQAADGGFGPGRGSASEPEPTAVAAMALDDGRARDWLTRAQHANGGFANRSSPLEDSATTSLVALALDDPESRRRALAYGIGRRAPAIGEDGTGDGRRRQAWGWTPTTYSWVEPTARVLLAIRKLSPENRRVEAEAVAMLRERRCPDNGWNYGNASVNGVDLRGYAQTTAVALLALQGRPPELALPGLAFLRRQWPHEPGALTLAQSLLVFRLYGDEKEAAQVAAAIATLYERTRFLGNTLSLAWAALATGDETRIARLRIPS